MPEVLLVASLVPAARIGSMDDGGHTADNEGVIMSDAQTWTVIGVLGAAFLGTLTIVSTLFVHVVRSEVRRLEGTFGARFDAMDRDIQALMRHTFGIDRGE